MSDSDHPIETEIKLRVPAASLALLERHPALRQARDSSAEQRDEATTYFDTPSLALGSQGISLRVRRSRHRYVQTVKIGDLNGAVARRREEWEWPIGTASLDLERAAQTPVGATLSAAELAALQPVFATEIHRTARLLRLYDGSAAELVLDQGRIVADRKTEPVSELELELKAGDIAPLYQLALDLARVVPLALEPASKAERGYRLCTGKPPASRKSRDVIVDARATAAEGFARIVGSVVDHMMANMEAALLGDVEAVHQMRVAIRRMRSALQLFKPCLQPETAAGFNAELRRIGLLIGEARDWDVFMLKTLPIANGKVRVCAWLDLLRTAAEPKRAAAHGAVQDELRGPAFTRLVLGLEGWAHDAARSPALVGNGEMARSMLELAPALLDRMLRKVRKRGQAIGGAGWPRLHVLRKSTKKLRYSGEFLAALYQRKANAAYVDGCKDLQERLGEINDAVMTSRLADRLGEAGHPDLVPAIGALSEWGDRRAGKASRQLPAAWRDFCRADRFW
jgi:triphosphatase